MLSVEVMDRQGGNGRVEQRTNMFVLATLSSASASGQVKIRNMSASGALIEGPVLPSVGEQLHLSRNGSSITGHIAWLLPGKAGVRFDRRIAVGDWTPGGNTAQHRVDRLVQQAKAGAVSSDADERSLTQGLSPSGLERLARAVEALSDALADDPATVARFGTRLQALEAASQFIRDLSRQAS